MAKLIDADALCRHLNDEQLANSPYGDGRESKKELEMMKFYNSVLDTVLMIIDAFQTVDAEPARHGRWKKVSEKSPKYVCTECNHLYNNKGYTYCPHCGAKMDLGDEEN